MSFSALTIAFAIAGLFFMESDILKTIAFGGVLVTLLAVLMAITVVPALITLMGRKLITPSVITRIPLLKQVTRAVGDSSSEHGFFSRLASRVHKHPWVIMVVVAAILAILASPIRDMRARTVFTEYLPEGAAVTEAYETMQDDYPGLRQATIVVIADAKAADTADLVTHIETLDHVDYVSPPAPLPSDENRTLINVHLDVEDQVSEEAETEMLALRDYDPGYGLLVGGPVALQHDFIASIAKDAPPAILVIVLAVLLLLFLMTGSLIVPLKALVINSFSLLASLGATVWIFEHGYLGQPQTPGLETFIVVCTICFGFGLAMDYEVFLLARIKEYWDSGVSNDQAVERGLQRSGRIITSAAAIIIAVFVGFTAGNMIAIKEIGVALALTVAIDATLVRLLLVPATMTVLGKWNWWAPKPLRALYSRFGIIH